MKKDLTPEELAQGQLDAYNNQDIEAFLKFYTKDVEVYNFPNELVYKGIDEMRKRYSKAWEENPGQHADLVNRIVVHNTSFDREHVTGRADGVDLDVVAIFVTEKNKISKVYFVRK